MRAVFKHQSNRSTRTVLLGVQPGNCHWVFEPFSHDEIAAPEIAGFAPKAKERSSELIHQVVLKFSSRVLQDSS